jgi:hypothetical protein
MANSRIWVAGAIALAFAAGFAARGGVETVATAQTALRVYELRTYTVPEDRLEALHARFRNHTMRVFQKHGMNNVVYFRPQDPDKAKTSLVYLISHANRQAADQNWAAFRKDPEWQKIAADSGVGPVKVASEFLEPTDYSPMK